VQCDNVKIRVDSRTANYTSQSTHDSVGESPYFLSSLGSFPVSPPSLHDGFSTRKRRISMPSNSPRCNFLMSRFKTVERTSSSLNYAVDFASFFCLQFRSSRWRKYCCIVGQCFSQRLHVIPAVIDMWLYTTGKREGGGSSWGSGDRS
jgi:hypothetical protein